MDFFVKSMYLKTHCFDLYVEGIGLIDSVEHQFRAKTSFYLFGRFRNKQLLLKKPGYEKKAYSLDIQIVPEHSYWRQTGMPVEIKTMFSREQHRKSKCQDY